MSFIEIEAREMKESYAMSDLQSHTYYELYFLLEGTRNVFFENKMFIMHENSVCVIPPFCMHKTEGGPFKRINLNVSPDLLSANERAFLDGFSKSVAFRLDAAAFSLVSTLLEEGLSVEPLHAQDKTDKLIAFTKTVLHFLQKNATPILSSSETETHSKRDVLVLKALSFINEHYVEEFSLSDLCERFFISKNRLCKRFAAAMGCSPMQYRSFVRLNKAKQLLTTTTKSLEEIAELCGFSSANYFSLIFKKEVGLSPAHYRKAKTV